MLAIDFHSSPDCLNLYRVFPDEVLFLSPSRLTDLTCWKVRTPHRGATSFASSLTIIFT